MHQLISSMKYYQHKPIVNDIFKRLKIISDIYDDAENTLTEKQLNKLKIEIEKLRNSII